jgi:glutathionylspermidine synthase
VIRFDFHYTREGWKISEANSDVPGGFNEASGLPLLLQEHYPELRPAGDPTRSLACAVHDSLKEGETIALVHATAFTDDRQVMLYLARELRGMGAKVELVSPEHLRWEAGRAFVRGDWYTGPAAFVFRFFPSEWLVNLRRDCGWKHFFHTAITPLSNPATALLTQTKRFPLVWNELTTPVPTWQRLLPETRSLDEVCWQRGNEWVLKPALGRVGDMVGVPGVTNAGNWRSISKEARARPRLWVAQQRFEAVAMETDQGPVFPCIGVYTIDGRAAGAYGRVARVPLIDQFAQDAAVLIAGNDNSMDSPKAYLAPNGHPTN